MGYIKAKKHERSAKAKKAATMDLTFGDLFDTCDPSINKKRGRKGRKDGGKLLRGAMEKHVLPTLRAHKIASVFASNVLPLLTAISDAGHNQQAVEMLGAVQQMIRWGGRNQPWKRLLIDCDVLALAEGRTRATDALIVAGGQWKCHDLRRTCATMMQSLGIPERIVHRCMNYARNDPLDRIYLQSDYDAQMRDAWRRWGDRPSPLLGTGTENARFLIAP